MNELLSFIPLRRVQRSDRFCSGILTIPFLPTTIICDANKSYLKNINQPQPARQRHRRGGCGAPPGADHPAEPVDHGAAPEAEPLPPRRAQQRGPWPRALREGRHPRAAERPVHRLRSPPRVTGARGGWRATTTTTATTTRRRGKRRAGRRRRQRRVLLRRVRNRPRR